MSEDRDLLKESFYEAIEMTRNKLYEDLPIIIFIIIALVTLAIILFILFIAVTQQMFWLLCLLVPLLLGVLFTILVIGIWSDKRS